ncbi:hypothetical protein PHMEG_00012711 [Phytophthora megakarya]|uniref:Uncharacterized protein n=1 Tax=Phytophthora megakarya TaxID=4795 RepID=A0A225WA66_9STRA|nr:hypothetical protein PHMEG_00012711 [Phytophthora megakarya]
MRAFWPSPCARYATVILSFVPTDLKTCCQNADTNFLSRSETMLVGIPCNFQMCSMKRRATPSAVTFFVVGTKWHRLVNLSTTTQIESTSRFVRGRSVMKFMEIAIVPQVFLAVLADPVFSKAGVCSGGKAHSLQ